MGMTDTLRAELDRIEAFLMGEEGEQLADILSALRGPDIEVGSGLAPGYPPPQPVKTLTTTHIRRAAFPKIARIARFGTYGHYPEVANMWTFYTNGITVDVEAGFKVSEHFGIHIRKAARSLGLLGEGE